MEFFEWIGLGRLIEDSLALNVEVMPYLVTFIIGGVLYLACLVFGGIGLFVMARRAGIGGRWQAFVPVVNTMYTGKLAGDSNLFGKRVKRAGLYAMIAELTYAAMYVFYLVLIVTLDPYYTKVSTSGIYDIYDYANVPEGLMWMRRAVDVCEPIMYVLLLAQVFAFVTLYVAFFRKYYARSPLLMTVISVILPLRGFVLFAVRNNTPVDYEAYLRERYGRYQAPPDGGSRPPEQPDPFGDFSSSPGGSSGSSSGAGEDPFSEFSPHERNDE